MNSDEHFGTNKVLVVLLSHQLPEQVGRTIENWKPLLGEGSLLFAYGGDASVFSQIKFQPKVFVDHPRLRLRDQQREHQSLAGVLHAACGFLEQHTGFEYVYLVEYDQIPLVDDLLDRMIARLDSERADVLAHHLHRIDGTSSAHYLHHTNEKRFHEYFAALSKRADKRVIFSMLATGSFWRRESFENVAAYQEPFPIYCEVYLPTLAHHLGYRVRDVPDQNSFVMPLGDRYGEIGEAQRQGGWTLHPVKRMPSIVSRS